MRRLGHSSQVSEDLTQESFLQAWQHIGQLRKDKALNSWLYRIANNVSRLYWRRHKGKEQGSIEGFEVSDGGQGREKIADLHTVVYPWSASIVHYVRRRFNRLREG